MSFLPPEPSRGHIYQEQNETAAAFPGALAADPEQPLVDGSAPTLPGTSEHHEGWTRDDIILSVALPIIMLALFGVSLRHCYVANRRTARFHERRLSLRALERAQVRENKRLQEKERKERLKEIENALVCKAASKCNCHLPPRKFSSMSDLTLHTNITDDMSISSSTHDVENPASDGIPANQDDGHQTCAICLDGIGGRDKVSWSKHQTCRHAFHRKCIEGWLKELKNKEGYCPCCRGPYLREMEAKTVDLNESSTVDEEAGQDETAAQIVDRDANEGMINENLQMNGYIPDNAAEQTLEEDTVIDANISAIGTTRSPGLEFTSFCVVHGLQTDDNLNVDAFAIQAVEDDGSPES
ncbi:hypothetical protein ACHAXT_007469 [Thalassiosira profunda]